MFFEVQTRLGTDVEPSDWSIPGLWLGHDEPQRYQRFQLECDETFDET